MANSIPMAQQRAPLAGRVASRRTRMPISRAAVAEKASLENSDDNTHAPPDRVPVRHPRLTKQGIGVEVYTQAVPDSLLRPGVDTSSR